MLRIYRMHHVTNICFSVWDIFFLSCVSEISMTTHPSLLTKLINKLLFWFFVSGDPILQEFMVPDVR